MPLVNIVVVLVVAGLLMWLINTYIPMAAPIKSLLNIVVFVVLVSSVAPASVWRDWTHSRIPHAELEVTTPTEKCLPANPDKARGSSGAGALNLHLSRV